MRYSIPFKTETNLQACYWYDASINDYRLKLITATPKGHYHSCKNDIGVYFESNILPELGNRMIESEEGGICSMVEFIRANTSADVTPLSSQQLTEIHLLAVGQSLYIGINEVKRIA